MGYNTVLYEAKTQVDMAAKMGVDVVWAPVNGFCGIEDTPHNSAPFKGGLHWNKLYPPAPFKGGSRAYEPLQSGMSVF